MSMQKFTEMLKFIKINWKTIFLIPKFLFCCNSNFAKFEAMFVALVVTFNFPENESNTDILGKNLLKLTVDVKTVLRTISAHNKNNCRDPTVEILFKLKR